MRLDANRVIFKTRGQNRQHWLYLTHTTPEAIKAKKTRYNVQELHCFVKEENEHRELTGDELEKFYRIKISGKTGKTGVKVDDDVARIIDELLKAP